jgi:ABC-type nitrate/sulfonate/bicarbonate transport system substrate-binding protein
MIDQNMVKTLNKEIKELEKHKAKNQKIYEKMAGKAKEEVIDEDENMMPY